MDKAIKNQNFKSTIFEIKMLAGGHCEEGQCNERQINVNHPCDKEEKLKFTYS